MSNRVRSPGIVVRRSAYEQVGGFRTDLPHAADWEMWTRLAAHGPDRLRRRGAGLLPTSRRVRHLGRVRSGANIRERVTAIGVLGEHIAPKRRALTTRRALAYAVVFAGRTALRSARQRDWSAAAAQARQALRCAWLLPGGVPRPPTRSSAVS